MAIDKPNHYIDITFSLFSDLAYDLSLLRRSSLRPVNGLNGHIYAAAA